MLRRCASLLYLLNDRWSFGASGWNQLSRTGSPQPRIRSEMFHPSLSPVLMSAWPPSWNAYLYIGTYDIVPIRSGFWISGMKNRIILGFVICQNGSSAQWSHLLCSSERLWHVRRKANAKGHPSRSHDIFNKECLWWLRRNRMICNILFAPLRHVSITSKRFCSYRSYLSYLNNFIFKCPPFGVTAFSSNSPLFCTGSKINTDCSSYYRFSCQLQ